MNILQLAPHDYKGGAGRITWYLFDGLKKRGVKSYLATGIKTVADPHIFEIDQTKYTRFQPAARARKWAEVMLGLEYFGYPATPHLPSLPPSPPDVLHAHNLQGKFFDLRELNNLSSRFPLVLTLHDTWMLSGHCAYAVGCERWQTGCGHCPDLTLPPQVQRDATAFNWRRKKKIYAESAVYVATPSRWLLSQVHSSMLMPGGIDSRVIHNGVDLAVFKPANRQALRTRLNIPEDAFVLTYVVASRMKKNAYKDFQTIDRALYSLQGQVPDKRRVVFLGLGEGGATENIGSIEKRFIPYQDSLAEVARYYQVADAYLHAARADTFPNAVLEALACGTPVIATAVGGISEQVSDGQTGCLVPAGDLEGMAAGILALMENPALRQEMAGNAAADAIHRFSTERMVDEYLEFYTAARRDFADRALSIQ